MNDSVLTTVVYSTTTTKIPNHQNCANDTFQRTFLEEVSFYTIQIPLKFVFNF